MSGSGVAESFGSETTTGASRLGVYGTAIGLAAGLSGVVLLVSTAFALADDRSDAAVMVVLAVMCLGFAWMQSQRPFEARSMRPVPTLTAAVVGYLFLAALSTIVYLATGSVSRVDDALYESVTGVATSSLTLFADPQDLSQGVLIWRSGTQWLGGLFAIGVAIGLLPFLGGSRELADHRARGARRRALASRPIPALRRVTIIYAAVTLVVTVALLVAGMSFHDAVAHAMSSVSSGGFSTHADSIGHFDSRAIKILMILVMAGTGYSLTLVWMVVRRQFRDTLRFFELRVYTAVLILASTWVWWFSEEPGLSAFDHVIDSVFTVVSLSTTTGHRVADWGVWHPGAVFMLIFLMVIGGMAGSVSGGLRWIRVVGLTQFVWRELQRQLHPRTVRSVKVGSAAISEESVDRWYAQLVFTMLIGGTGAVFLAFFGSDVLEALTLALGAVSTTGPAIAEEGGTLFDASTLSRSDRAALMPVMLAGRVALTPAFVAIGLVFFGMQRRLSASAFRRRRMGLRR